MGRGLQVSPDDLEIAGVLSPTWHICNSAGKQRPPRKVDPDANLSLVHNRMSLGTIELNAHMYCLHEFPRGHFKQEARCLLLCKALSFLDKKSVPVFLYLCLYFIYIHREEENISDRSIFGLQARSYKEKCLKLPDDLRLGAKCGWESKQWNNFPRAHTVIG